MDTSSLVNLFAQLPEDKQLQALAAQGISIHPSLLDSMNSEDAILKEMDASRLEPWGELRIPQKNEPRPGIYDRNKVVVDKLKAIDQIPDPGISDPMLASFEADTNSQGGF